jgi:hypothetical protein
MPRCGVLVNAHVLVEGGERGRPWLWPPLVCLGIVARSLALCCRHAVSRPLCYLFGKFVARKDTQFSLCCGSTIL